MEIVSKVSSIEIMSGSRFVPVGAFGQKKIGYKKGCPRFLVPGRIHDFSEREKMFLFVEAERIYRRQNFSILFCPSDSVFRREKISCDCRIERPGVSGQGILFCCTKILMKLIIPTFTT
ncbi:hypothetical protein CEXT_789781 [Caerostris extrusa]|uniref:Uncharacterized protein n=1 Tax=Caerostris extrusa TaxID=172846 RepID=A0AAV4YFJ9_CAEEX|nr:hypothetical protein CEXT_789781 [Caerostris extrusa]